MNDLDEALLAAEKAVMQSNRGQDVYIIRGTIDEAVKHAKHARIDFNSLSTDFLNLARSSYLRQSQTFTLAEGCRSPLASTYAAIEYLCSQPQEDTTLLEALDRAQIYVISGLREELHCLSPNRIGAISSLTPGAAYLITEGLNEDSVLSHEVLQTTLRRCANEAFFLHHSGLGDDCRKYLQEAYLYWMLLDDPPSSLPEQLRRRVRDCWANAKNT
jgi:hypothetical protein